MSLLRPVEQLSVLSQLLQSTDKCKKVVFDDEGNPHEVHELTEAVIPSLGLLGSRFRRLPRSSNLQRTVARAFSNRCAVTMLQCGASH